MNIILRIEELIQFLPEKDRLLSIKFLNKRDFESILELVKSDIYLVEKNDLLEKPKLKYRDIDITKLTLLREVLIDYISILYPDDDYNDFYDEIS